MAVLKVEIELPQNLLAVLGISESEFSRQAKEWVLLGLFQGGKISSGKAAEVLGLSKVQFLDLLNQRNLPYLDTDLKDLEREVVAFEAVLAKVPDAEPDPWDHWTSPPKSEPDH